MISIIITNYNKGKYLLKTLKSCKNQTDKNFQIVFFDDNSTDNSLEIVKKFFYMNKKIKYKIIENKKKKISNNNLNQLNGIIKSLKYCKGDYISLLDGDDYFAPEKIKFLNNRSNFKNKKIIYNSYYNLIKNKFYKNNRHFKKRIFLWPIFPPTSCVTIKKDFFKKLLKKINTKTFLSCYVDFRIALYVARNQPEEIYYTKKKLTIYRKTNSGVDSQFVNIYKLPYWKRKFEAFCLLFVL